MVVSTLLVAPPPTTAPRTGRSWAPLEAQASCQEKDKKCDHTFVRKDPENHIDEATVKSGLLVYYAMIAAHSSVVNAPAGRSPH